ncbi:MAG: FliA/WhiG family RNA polymerase sigma factor [Dehalococcoidia bacterium]|nr:FliA/WhiG family RNA polymerase sigma factor [Dehalococcoidia bacterium]
MASAQSNVVYMTPGRAMELDQAVIEYLPLVKYTVGRLLGTLKLDAVMDHEDLLAFGTMGLIQALKAYDPTRNTKFSSLAMLRIKGAIIDAIRALDPMPRSARMRAREITRTIDELYTELGRTPAQAEVSARLGLTTAEYSQILATVERTTLPLHDNNRWDDDAGGYHYTDVADDDPTCSPNAQAERTDDRATLLGAMDRLNPREREVVQLHYQRDLSLKEISERLRLSQSRISQIHSSALRKLRFAILESNAAA